jgi:hypothetical protein
MFIICFMQTGPQNGTYDTGKIPPPRRNAALLYQDTAAWNGHEAVVRVSFCTQPKQTSHSESLNCGCAFFDPPPVTRSEKLKFQPPSRAGLKRCEWLKRGSAGGDGKSLGLSARVPEWAALCAHPQFREFGARLGGGANPRAFKSGPGGVAMESDAKPPSWRE